MERPTMPDDFAYPLSDTVAYQARSTGLTKREHMATQIMAGFASCNAHSLPSYRNDHGKEVVDWARTAEIATDVTDALIHALNKPKG